MNINHKFNRETAKAGYNRLSLFMRRHPDISIRKAEDVSIARATGMNRTTVQHYFELLQDILTKNKLLDKPSNIFNMDEIGLHLNNKPAEVLATKESKSVISLTSGEKEETISVVIACCNAEGMSVLKISRKKHETGIPR